MKTAYDLYDFFTRNNLTFNDVDDLWEGNWYKDIPTEFQNNRNVVMTICTNAIQSLWESESHDKLIDVFTTHFSNQRDFMKEYLSNSGWSNEMFIYASDEIQSDYELLLLYCDLGHPESKVEDVFCCVSESVKSNRDLMLRLVKDQPNTFISFVDDFKNDEEIATIAVKQNGLLLKFVSKRLKSNENLVRSAIKNNIKAVLYSDKSLRREFDGVFYEEYWKVINGKV